jgi:hypothetical protein
VRSLIQLSKKRRGAFASVSGVSDTGWVAHPPAGLCDTCAHQKLIRNTRGSTFSLCERSKVDPAYPKYPRVPVARCGGHEPRRS